MAEPTTPWSLSELAKPVQIEQHKRELIITSLTLLGIFFLTSFALIHFLANTSSLGLFYLACAAVSSINLVYLRRTHRDGQVLAIFNCVLGLLLLVLLMKGAGEGEDALWVYPVLAFGIFINRFKVAAIFAACFIVLSAVVLFAASDVFVAATYTTKESIRLLVSLGALAGIALLAVYRHEEARQQVIELHSSDIRKLAFYDRLTGLANRSSFHHWLQKILDRLRQNGHRLALLYIDLDNFKQVNDRHGHQVGDQLLIEFGNRLADCVRPDDGATRIWAEEDIARLAGDEFVVTLTNLNSPSEANLVAQRILGLFEDGFEVSGIRHPVTVSIGIAMSDGEIDNAETLVKQADAAMHQAKDKGKNAIQFYSSDIADALKQRRRIERELQNALDENQFKLAYMPIFDSESLNVVAVEALVRCDSPLLSRLGPEHFIPVAETSGLIRALDRWVLDKAMTDLKILQDQHGFGGLMCINISALELHNTEFPHQLSELITRHRVIPSSLELEVTETSLTVDDQLSVQTLQKIRTLGIGLSLDDFGTGYTAFNQLINYPVNSLKIDRSFVHGIFGARSDRRKMAGMLQRLAELYDLRVVAEGVETHKQLKYLQRIGCEWLQGFYLSLPLTREEFVELLAAGPLDIEQRFG